MARAAKEAVDSLYLTEKTTSELDVRIYSATSLKDSQPARDLDKI